MAIELGASPLTRRPHVKRLTVLTSPASFKAAKKAQFFICRNVGTTPIRINFDNDSVGDYFELAAGEWLPHPIELSGSININGASIGGNGKIECIFW